MAETTSASADPSVAVKDAASASHSVSKSKRILSALWSATKFVVPTVLSCIALGISAQTHSEQRQIDKAAAEASHRLYAQDVSFWLTPTKGGGAEDLVIQNSGATPVYDTYALVSVGWHGNISESLQLEIFNRLKWIPLGIIPPCKGVHSGVASAWP